MTDTPFIWDLNGKKIPMNIVAGFHNVCYEG